MQICSFVHPQSLLRSRVTKNFHEHLMSKKSAWIWKHSLGRVDELSPCPSELIEPAWIALVYSLTCTLCGNGRATDVYWVVLARVCATCRKDALVFDRFMVTL
ncbi:hypothetical protein FOMPIDRAFT_1118243 [Fomitopsis schrenkii]|uniref:Uncharacterized protein n=1 Tax=Fomitopsis schrenkii TaxID=2126942 RepID=S8EBT1_FOMSC|nr:hypothetical protein FOMPIDRAFT_1118243 [Fomitopsis schrenkii]